MSAINCRNVLRYFLHINTWRPALISSFSSYSGIIYGYGIKPQTSPTFTLIQVAGWKHMVAIKRRCKDCRFTRVENRLAIVCSAHPRHKQIQQGIGSSKRLHKPYPWRWPDPFDKKYSLSKYNEDRYMNAFK